MNKLRVAAIQLNSKDDKKANLKQIEYLVNLAADDGARLVVLPEYASYLSDTGEIKHAEDFSGSTIEYYKNIAKKRSIYLHCGSFIEKSDEINRAYNTSVLLNPLGNILAAYRKIHLFDVYIPDEVDCRESRVIKPGNKIITVNTEIGHLGFSICYDLRFPELYRALSDRGANLIFVPAAFTLYTGKDHWETLLRARAIENQVFIVAPNQFGIHPQGKHCYGNSMVIDPWGTVIAKASEGIGYTLADIDWQVQEDIKKNMPCQKHKVLV